MKKINKKTINSFPLWFKIAIIFALFITLIITILVVNNYLYNRNKVIESYVTNTETILKLEMSNLTDYIKELTFFSIQPCYDSRFARIIETKNKIDEVDINYTKEQMKAYYYTRNDLNSYEIFLMNQGLIVGRDRGEQHISVSSYNDISDYENNIFKQCASSKYFLSIVPSTNSSDFFTFYHSIVQIKDKASLAFVKCNIDKDFLHSLISSYNLSKGEILLLYNTNGDLLFSSNDSFSQSKSIISSTIFDENINNKSKATIDGTEYLIMSSIDNKYGLKLISLTPYKELMKNTVELFHNCLLQGIIVWLIFVVIINVPIHYLLKPLNDLADHMRKIGEGDFNTKISIRGNNEIANLGNTFNNMSEQIEKLINENYIVKLNEQTARLIALEAQINPHFLYNTLQAISTEALVNDQIQIHEMVVSLASILRYSIKGGDLVTLADESAHVDKYIYLQKVRMVDKLNYTINISDDAYTCMIPKICLQTLVENSIIHGIGGNITAISIVINAYILDNLLHIDVTDNGQGMDEDKIEEIKNSFSSEKLSTTQTKDIGLANLYGRLYILFKKDDCISIDSKINKGTTIKITLPVKKGI